MAIVLFYRFNAVLPLMLKENDKLANLNLFKKISWSWVDPQPKKQKDDLDSLFHGTNIVEY